MRMALMPNESTNHDLGFTASELEIKESVDGDVTSTSYVDSDGVITDAIDVGYATVQRTRNAEGKTVEEVYLDADGNPVGRYNDYFGLTYEYRDGSEIIRYLDADKNFMTCGSGYAAIMRTLDADGRAVDDCYYDLNMKTVKCSGGYYGIHREYDNNGQNSSITYLNRDGQPVCNTSGYAMEIYQRDINEVITEKYYFDAQKKPVKSSLGQYGERYQRDERGWVTQITYLDINGSPSPTNAGYTILKRTYYRDGAVDADMYFDADGSPVAMSKGQYGIKHSGKITLLLDKNGRVMLCVDNILNGFPYMVVVFGCIICLLILILPRTADIFLTAAYVLFIFYETLMFRETGNERTNFILFSYADRFFTDHTIRVGVVNNIWLFIPLGTGLYKIIRKKWILLIPFLFSVMIESIQYFTGLGIAEFDDVLPRIHALSDYNDNVVSDCIWRCYSKARRK